MFVWKVEFCQSYEGSKTTDFKVSFIFEFWEIGIFVFYIEKTVSYIEKTVSYIEKTSGTLKKNSCTFLGEKWACTVEGHPCSSGLWGLIPIFLVEEQREAWAGVPASASLGAGAGALSKADRTNIF